MAKFYIALATLFVFSYALAYIEGPYTIHIFIDDVGEYDLSEFIEIADRPWVEVTYSVIPNRLTPQVAGQLRAEQARGQRICLHSYFHHEREFNTTYKTASALLQSGKKKFGEMGLSTDCFRPPWDSLNPESERAVRDAGLEIIEPRMDPFFWNPAPVQTARSMKIGLLRSKEIEFSIHMPLNEKTLKALDTLLKIPHKTTS